MSDEQKRLCPLFLVKPDTISAANIKRAEKACGIIIIPCTDPEGVRYLDPPITEPIDAQARAAMSLVRMLINRQQSGYLEGDALIKWFTRALLNEPEPASIAPVKRGPT